MNRRDFLGSVAALVVAPVLTQATGPAPKPWSAPTPDVVPEAPAFRLTAMSPVGRYVTIWRIDTCWRGEQYGLETFNDVGDDAPRILFDVMNHCLTGGRGLPPLDWSQRIVIHDDPCGAR